MDPRSRRISLELTPPGDVPQWAIDRHETNKNGVYNVVTSLRSSGVIVSNLTSTFDSHYNQFKAVLDAFKTNQKYTLDFDLFNKTVASATILKNDKIVGITTAQLVKGDSFNNLILNLRWSRFWRELQLDARGESSGSSVSENANFNSHLGDVYSVLSEDLKQSVENFRAKRKEFSDDVQKFGFVLADFYLNVSPVIFFILFSSLSCNKNENYKPK